MRRANRSAFTLIELLVVIAVITIVAALLFPVFAQAREKARQATCTSNIKNLGLAMLMYAHDHDDTYPPAFYLPYGNWPNVVRPYMGQGGEGAEQLWTRGIMLCPSAGMKGWAYSMSRALSPMDSRAVGSHVGRPLAAVTRPAQIIMLAEAPQVKEWEGAGSVLAAEQDCWGGKLGDGTTHPAYRDGDGIVTDLSRSCFSTPRYRHSGGAMIVWADGHVSRKPKHSLRWCRHVNIDDPGPDCPP
jgi:prepilin-type N-terminal cleavage/methylation domain-containing protein/prepilin-type processing-associated H-X9-DG protein